MRCRRVNQHLFETGLRCAVAEEELHRGRRMLLAGPGLRTGAQRRGHRPTPLGAQDTAAHQAVGADQRGRLLPDFHCWPTVPLRRSHRRLRSAAAADRSNGVDQRDQLGDVFAVAVGEGDRERDDAGRCRSGRPRVGRLAQQPAVHSACP
jgi:hypothetical protein